MHDFGKRRLNFLKLLLSPQRLKSKAYIKKSSEMRERAIR